MLITASKAINKQNVVCWWAAVLTPGYILNAFSVAVCVPELNPTGFDHCPMGWTFSVILLSLSFNYLITLIVAQIPEGQWYCCMAKQVTDKAELHPFKQQT